MSAMPLRQPSPGPSRGAVLPRAACGGASAVGCPRRRAIGGARAWALGALAWALMGVSTARAEPSQLGPTPADGQGQAAAPAAPSARALRAAEHDARAKLLEDHFQAGVLAYRAGDHGEARRIWSDLLASDPPLLPPGHGQPLDFDVSRLLYNLGNASLRCGQPLEALGAYTAALRVSPRDRDLGSNLARARAAAGLPEAPAPRLSQQLCAWLAWPTPAERRWLVLFALVPLGLALLYEALAGGREARRALALCLLLACGAAAPLGYELLGPSPADALVVAPGGAPLYSEPRLEARQVGLAPAGEALRELDRLPGWRRIEDPSGLAAWTPADGLFRLAPPFGKRPRP